MPAAIAAKAGRQADTDQRETLAQRNFQGTAGRRFSRQNVLDTQHQHAGETQSDEQKIRQYAPFQEAWRRQVPRLEFQPYAGGDRGGNGQTHQGNQPVHFFLLKSHLDHKSSARLCLSVLPGSISFSGTNSRPVTAEETGETFVIHQAQGLDRDDAAFQYDDNDIAQQNGEPVAGRIKSIGDVNTARASATWLRLNAATRRKDKVLANRLMTVSMVSMVVTSARSPNPASVSSHL